MKRLNGPTAKPPALPMLTEMRGVAALLVYHMHIAGFIPILMVMRRAYLGVDFFFILSGFVLTHVYREWFCPRLRPGSLKDFFWARFARIYPLLFVIATLYLFMLGFVYHQWPLKQYLLDIFLLNIINRTHGLNPPGWSVAAEGIAYVFAPFLIRWILAGKFWRIAIAFLASFAWLLWVVYFRADGCDIHSFIRCVPEFTFGICTYEICRRWPFSNRLGVSLFAIGIILPIISLTFIRSIRPSDILCVLSFCVLISAAVHLKGKFVQGFNLLFGYLGEISYSIYLVHTLVMNAIAPTLLKILSRFILNPAVQLFVFYLILTSLVILSASVSYRYIELPARAFFKRRTRRPEIAPAPSVPVNA